MSNKPKILLIIGCQRSGTTLLASMLGGHSEVNMLFESTTGEVFRQMGKEYSGNKLLAWRQIRMKQRATKFGFLINRVANFHFVGKKHQKIRLFPTSQLSIEDYIRQDASIIVVVREKEEVISSMLSRTEMTRKQAEHEYQQSMKIIDTIGDRAHVVDFYRLVHYPEEVLAEACKFLGLQFEERMLQGVSYNFVYPDSKLNKDRANRPFDPQPEDL